MMLEGKSELILNVRPVVGIHAGEAASVWGDEVRHPRALRKPAQGSGCRKSHPRLYCQPRRVINGGADKVNDRTGNELPGRLNRQGIPPGVIAVV